MNKRLYTWAEKENKISKEQAGFRKGYSTTDHMFTLVSVVKRKLNSRRGGKVYVAFAEYKKAFDTVDRDKLWETLEKLKTPSKMINMIKAIYTSVQSCTEVYMALIMFIILDGVFSFSKVDGHRDSSSFCL